MGLLLIAIPLGVFIGVLTLRRGEAGRGATMILTALGLPALSVAVFADPASQMYGPDGVLAFGRSVGFSVAQAATGNGALAAGGFDAQVDGLTASILTHVVREPLQLWNFGHVVDRVGGCGAAWSAAVQRGVGDSAVKAMAACGDSAAVRYAENLDGGHAWIGAVMLVCALLLGWFMVAAGWAVARVSVQAIWTTAILLPALWLGGIPGAAQRRAVDTVWAFFRHGIEVLIYIVYVSVIVLAIDTVIARPLPAQLGGTNPFAHVLIMGGVCAAALMLLRHIRSDLSGSSRRGLVGRAAEVAFGIGVGAAVRGGGSWAAGGLRGLSRRASGGGAAASGAPGGLAPWERIDQAAAAGGSGVLGEPRDGFAAVGDSGGSFGGGVAPGGGGGSAGAVSGGGAEASGGSASGGGFAAIGLGEPSGGSSRVASEGAAEVSAVGGATDSGRSGASGRRSGGNRGRGTVGGAAAGRGTKTESFDLELPAAKGDPTAESLPGIDAVIATTGYGEEVPLPEEPPDEETVMSDGEQVQADVTDIDAINDGGQS